MKEFERHLETINSCRFCSMCRHVCTVGEAMHRETVTPKGKGFTLFTIIKELQSFDTGVSEVMYQCALCQLCLEWCVGNWDITGPILEARRRIVSLGLEPCKVRQMKASIMDEGNPYGGKRAERFSSIHSLDANRGASVVYFAGCGAAYKQPEIVRAALAVLDAAAISHTILPDEECCGAYLDVMGYAEEARILAQRNAERIEASGCHTLILGCPHCFYTVKELYPQWGIKLSKGIRIVHITKYLQELVMQGRIKLGSLSAKVTYHDPCRLGRYCGIYEEPRQVIVSFQNLELVEMRWNRQKANCCGHGSGLAITFPQLAEEIGMGLVTQAKRTGADILITACQSCKTAFSHSLSPSDDLRVMDLVEFVAENLL